MLREPTTVASEPQPLFHVTVHGATIAYQEYGQGAPIVLLHGSPDTHAMWGPLMTTLASHGRCIALDLPGFGESSLPATLSLSLDTMADVVHDFLAALHITEPVVLVTTDFGGHYGLAFASKYPDQVRGVAISNTNFFHDYQWHSAARLYRMPLLGELLMATSSRQVITRTLKQVAPALPNRYIEDSYASGFGSPRVRKTILRMYRERQPQDFVGWEDRWLAVAQHRPVIVLWGDKDPFIAPAYAERFGAVQVHHFAEYSHWLPLEAPDRYAAVLVPWLGTL
jgi:pimeloyl-ACP methyl ester carboxylesterase